MYMTCHPAIQFFVSFTLFTVLAIIEHILTWLVFSFKCSFV